MNSVLWYCKPASEWKEGLLVGNGVLAGAVLGGAESERIALNHELLWRARNRDRDIEPRAQHLEEIRSLFFEGKVFEAGTLANETLGGLGGVSGQPNRVDPYQPLGDLTLTSEHASVEQYRRELDLERAVATVEYEADGIRLRREVLAHAVHPVLAVRLSAPEGGVFFTTAALSRIADPECSIEAFRTARGFGFRAGFPEGVRFAVTARVIVAGGSASASLSNEAAVRLDGCREAVLILTAAVTRDGSDPAPRCDEQLQGVPEDWDTLLASHVEAHASRYSRVRVELGDARGHVPTDERLAALRAGEPDDSLLALYFNFGRYLLLASSWGCEFPANLQGKWNEQLDPPWQCDLHHDVNLQMNYWPAEVCGLPECTGALFAHLERSVPHGREVARKLYGCDGIFLPIQTDPWGRCTPESRGWDVWTGAAAWLAQHFW